MPTTEFDKQAFLLSYYDDISNTLIDYTLKSDNGLFEFVSVLNTTQDKSFPTTMAILNNRIGVEKFTELKTYQYNSILPRIRLYRVDYDQQKKITAQKEFIFYKDAKYTVTDMTTPLIKNNCGIKSINWRLAGTNPVTAEKQVEVEIQFYFDSINAFSGGSYDKMISAWNNSSITNPQPFEDKSFSFCELSKTSTINYWSLLFHPQIKDKNSYDTYKFRIKAEVGWEDIDSNIKTQLKLSDVDDVVKKLNYTFFLNLVKHSFALNEDGSLMVTANYIASFENSTFNKQFDVLGTLQEELKGLKEKTLSELSAIGNGSKINKVSGAGTIENPRIDPDEVNLPDVAVSSRLVASLVQNGVPYNDAVQIEQNYANLSLSDVAALSKLTTTLSDPSKLAALQECTDYLPSSISSIINSSLNNITSLENIAKTTSTIADVYTKYTENATNVILSKFYSSFFKKLIESEYYYTIYVNKNTKDKWLSWYNNNLTKPNFSECISAASAEGVQSTGLAAAEDINIDSTIQELSTEADKIFTDDNSDALNPKNSEKKDDTESVCITFTTFGLVIDAMIKAIKEHISQSNTGSTTIDALNELNRIKIILGNISDENQIFAYNKEGNLTLASVQQSTITYPQIKNLAFVPVEISLLKTFLIQNIIKPKKTTYPLYSFLQDALSSLVLSTINSYGNTSDEVDKYSNISLANSLVSLGNEGQSEHPLQSITYKNIIESNKITTDILKSYYVSKLNPNHNTFYSYYIIYDKTLKDFRPNRNVTDDSKQGVYHYTYGQDYGLVKSINFTKIDQPYLKEAKAVGTKTFYLGQFRDRYNADVTMIGNNIYYPGMLLYLRPTIESNITSNPNFSTISGIGGYYMVLQVESSITEDGYETKLKTIWQNDGFDLPSTSLSGIDKCIAFIEDLGLKQEKADIGVGALLQAEKTKLKESLTSEIEIFQKEADELESVVYAVENDPNVQFDINTGLPIIDETFLSQTRGENATPQLIQEVTDSYARYLYYKNIIAEKQAKLDELNSLTSNTTEEIGESPSE